MPLQTYDAEITKSHIAKLKPALAFILAKSEVSEAFQAVLGANNVTSLPRFAGLSSEEPGMIAIIKSQFGLDVETSMDDRMLVADVCAAWALARVRMQKSAELEADAQLAEQSRIVPACDHKLLKRAYEKVNGEMPIWETPGRYFLGTKIEQAGEDEPQVEKLTEVASKRENESDVWVPVWTEDGRMQTKKGALVKVRMPSDGEELRNRHRLICNAWMMVHLQHANRAWLEGLGERDWTRFTDYILAKKWRGTALW